MKIYLVDCYENSRKTKRLFLNLREAVDFALEKKAKILTKDTDERGFLGQMTYSSMNENEAPPI
jgi:hypothetical protein